MLNLFYRNFQLTILSIILILVWGFSSFFTLPRLEDPILVSREALVETHFSGASAYRVESLVTEKIEEEISEIEEIKDYESISRAGISIIQIKLLDRIEAEEAERIWSQIRDKLNDAIPELPQGAAEPELKETKVKAYALIAGLTWEQDNQPNYAILRRKAESLKDKLRAIPGTEKVDIFGDPDEEITVEINSSDLVALDLTAQDLSQQIQLSDSKEAAGQLRSFNNNLQIEVEGELDSLMRVRQIPLRFGNDGQFTRLGDIALVKKGIKEPSSDLAIVNGNPTVALGVFVESEQRIDQWAKTARQVIDKNQEQLPSALGLHVILDQSKYVETRLNKLILNLLFGALLVFGVTWFMMGWQSALIVGTALPLSMLMVFGGMKILGISLNQMSVTGLIVALGILIDNAIVLVDEVQNHLKKGLKPAAAIHKSVRHLSIPLLGSTITTILAFLPIALLPGSVGEFVGAIGLNVILAVSSSLFLALTIIPSLTAKLHQYSQSKNRKTKQAETQSSNSVWWKTGFYNPVLTRIYHWTLDWTSARPVLGILLALILPIVGFFYGMNLEMQFFPSADRDQLRIELEMPSSTSLAQTWSIVQQARQQLMRHPEVVDVHWFVGESAPQFYYNLIRDRRNEANFAQALVQLNSISSSSLTQTLQDEMDKTFPAAQTIVRQLEQGPPVKAPIEARLYGHDLKRLQDLGNKIRAELAKIEYVSHTRDDFSEVLPQLEFQADEESARLAGLDHTSIAQQLNTMLEGSLGGSILESTEELPVRVRISDIDRGDLEQITSLNLLGSGQHLTKENTSSINSIPLTALGKIKLVPEIASVARRNGQRVNTIQGFIQAGVLPAKVLAQFKQRLASNDFQLPPGYWIEWGGEAAERTNAVKNLTSTIGVIIVLTVGTIVLSLGSSFQLASIIGVVAIASFGLGLFSVGIFGYPFGFNPIIGTVGLIGIAVNDSIVVLSALREDPACCAGNRKAVSNVVFHSSRHVITTTLTTMIGFLPLMLDGGEFWPPLAVALAGGVGGATLLALYFVPCTYLLLSRRNSKESRMSRSYAYSSTNNGKVEFSGSLAEIEQGSKP